MNSSAIAIHTVYSWLNSQYRKSGITLTCLLVTLSAFAQDISIHQIEMDGRTITFSYSLNDTARGRTYVIGLFSSHDNFTRALQKTTGDVGIGITPGPKKIVWNAGEEFGSTFEGTVSFEIRSKVYVPFIKLQDFDRVPKRRRGVPFEVTWIGGRPQNILRFDLLQGNHTAASFLNIANSGHCSLTIPLDVRPGLEYRFKIYDPKNDDDVVYSRPFIVSRRTPLLYTVAPVVLLAAAGVLTWGKSSSEDTDEISPFPAAPVK